MTSDDLPTSSGSSRQKTGSVLVVDDDRFTLKLIEKVLRQEGYDVTCTESEKAAKTVFKENPSDVVVTDLYMAGKSGLDLLRYLKELQPGIPVIILTAGTALKNVTDALREGAFDYLQKPFQPKELVQLVSRARQSSLPTIPRNRQILVTEDDPVTLGVIRMTLTDAGYDVFTADTAGAAETLFAENDIDVMVVDVGLPDKSGVELLTYCQQRRPEVPVVMVTASTSVQIAIECLRGGAFDFLVKPFEEEVLLGRVVRAYERKALTDANRRLEKERQAYESKLEQLGRQLEGRVTERTEQLDQLQRLSENILRSIPTGLVVTDRNGKVTAANPAALALLGTSEDGMVDRHMSEIPVLGPLNPAIRQTIESGEKVLRAEATLTPSARNGRLISYTLAPLMGAGLPQPMGAVLHLTDITQQRSFEAGVIQANRLAALGQIAAVMAHEVNSRLTIIVGFADLLKSKLTHEPMLRDQTDKILLAATQCETFVENMLKSIRTEPATVGELDLREVITDVLALFDQELGQRHIQVATRFDRSVGKIWGNSSELRQVLFNMVLNARDAMSQGGTLTISARSDESEVRIAVADTGCGIPPDHVQTIFTPFYTTKSSEKGTGLGLLICSTIVERHKGRIEVESRVGEGTTFTIRLPLQALTTSPWQACPSSGSATTGAAGPPRVLVVDDDPLICELCQTSLAQMDLQVLACATAEEALEHLARGSFHLALVDVKLPRMDGLQLATQIKASGSKVPVVLITGMPVPELPDFKRLYDVSELLKKPFTQAALRRVVEGYLKR